MKNSEDKFHGHTNLTEATTYWTSLEKRAIAEKAKRPNIGQHNVAVVDSTGINKLYPNSSISVDIQFAIALNLMDEIKSLVSDISKTKNKELAMAIASLSAQMAWAFIMGGLPGTAGDAYKIGVKTIEGGRKGAEIQAKDITLATIQAEVVKLKRCHPSAPMNGSDGIRTMLVRSLGISPYQAKQATKGTTRGRPKTRK